MLESASLLRKLSCSVYDVMVIVMVVIARVLMGLVCRREGHGQGSYIDVYALHGEECCICRCEVFGM